MPGRSEGDRVIRWPRCVAGVLVLLASSALYAADEPAHAPGEGGPGDPGAGDPQEALLRVPRWAGQSRHHPGARLLQARRQWSEPGPLCQRPTGRRPRRSCSSSKTARCPPAIDRARPEEEIQTVKDWIGATAPSYPRRAFDDRTTLQEILNDLQKHPEAAPNLRYFSLAHLVRDDADLPDLKRIEFNLNKALTWCGVKPPAGKPAAEPVDGTATLFRFDVRHAGWDNRSLFFRSPKGGSPDLFPLTPYDLILLEYPHAVALLPGDALTPRLTDYFAAARLARPMPFLRGLARGTTRHQDPAGR